MQTTNVLRVKILDNCPNKSMVIAHYQARTNYPSDAGVDLVFPDDVNFTPHMVNFCGLGIACELILANETNPSAFDLLPRSSISYTPLIIANSVGIIDAGYRGEIIAALKRLEDARYPNNAVYTVLKGHRLLQIVAPNRKPTIVQLVDTLSITDRGNRGFGSTN